LERVYDGGVLFFPRWKRRGRGRRDAVDEDPMGCMEVGRLLFLN